MGVSFRPEPQEMVMTNTILDALKHMLLGALLAATVAACSTAPAQTQIASGGGRIRSWADWMTVPSAIPSDQKPISDIGAVGD
jgi:hypothetical protein